MTGQAQSQSLTQAQFKTKVCERIYGLFDCTNGLYVDVQTFTSFGSVTMTLPAVDADGKFVTQYQTGGPGDIVLVRLFYQWPVYASLLDRLSNNGKRLLVSSAAFRNEPYGS
jgi:hypothetical protein